MAGCALLVADAAAFDSGTVRKVLPSPPSPGDGAGTGVAAHGPWVVIGENAPLGDVFIYAYDGSAYAQHSSFGTDESFDGYGQQVAVYGDWVMVAANSHDVYALNDGAVFVYKYTSANDSWTPRQTLGDPAGVVSGYFGWSIALLDDTLAVGQPDHGVGHIHLYGVATDWWLETDVLSSGTVSGLGTAVDVRETPTGTWLAAGARSHNSHTGAVVMFEKVGTWTETQTLEASDGASLDQFGAMLSLDPQGEFLAVGDTSAVYLFEHAGGSWSETNKFPTTATSFPKGAVSSSRLVVSDPKVSSDSGEARVYEHATSWTETEVLVATAPSGSSDRFGHGLAWSGDVLIVGAYGDGSNAGSAYIFGDPASAAGAGVIGDPIVIDFSGHRMVAGQQPLQWYLLFQGLTETVAMQTNSARGRHDGYFVGAIRIMRPGCGSVTLEPLGLERELRVSGDPCMMQRVAVGDNGLAAVPVGGGTGLLFAKTHVSQGFSFLNIKLMGSSTGMRRACVTGMLCDEEHVDELLLGGM